MLRLILIIVLFLLSLLILFRAPMNWLWYVSILVTECCWFFFIAVLLLLLWHSGNSRYNFLSCIIGVASLLLFSLPVLGALRMNKQLEALFPAHKDVAAGSAAATPFRFWRMFTGSFATQVPSQTMTYDAGHALTLDFYPASLPGNRPCVIVVHGGSWAGGDSRQLPELNTVLAKAGYQVASINYRLAPEFRYPAPVEDLKAALAYLRAHASNLQIDTNNIALLGRSAGGQIVLSAAYTLHDPAIQCVVSFYGPADMVWGYANPTNPLVLNSRKIMEDYLGGTYQQVPQQYLQSSAIATASKQSPPALLLHGEHDPLVSHLHGIRLGHQLDSLHVRHKDVYLPWATHGFDWTLNGPGGQLSTWCVLQFLATEMPVTKTKHPVL